MWQRRWQSIVEVIDFGTERSSRWMTVDTALRGGERDRDLIPAGFGPHISAVSRLAETRAETFLDFSQTTTPCHGDLPGINLSIGKACSKYILLIVQLGPSQQSRTRLSSTPPQVRPRRSSQYSQLIGILCDRPARHWRAPRSRMQTHISRPP